MNNKPLHWLRRLSALVFVLPWLAHAALAPGMAAQVLSLQGGGEQRRTALDPWAVAKPTDSIAGGAYVRTLAASKMALLFADDTQVRLNQNSVLQVKSVATATTETTLQLALGRAWAQTKRASGSKLNFETPAATAGIRGTDWELDVAADGKTMLTVFSGTVDFSNAQGSLTVGSNEAAVAEVGKAPVRLLLSNPRERIQWVNALSANPLRYIDTSDVPPALAAAFAALTQGDLATARQSLAGLLGKPAAAPAVAYLLMSDLQLFDGEFDAAAATLEAGLIQWADEPELLAQLARAQMLADKLTDSERTLARKRRADTASVFLAQGELAHRQGQKNTTLQAFTRATQVAPADDRGWFALGSAQNELELIRPARANILQALQLQPLGAGYQGELGTLETYVNDFGKAYLAFDTALTQNPADYVALTGLGLLRLKQGQPAAALDAFLRAGVMEPRYARAKTYTAVAYYQLGRHQDAIDTLQQATALDDKDPIPHLFLSQIFTDLLRPGEAVQAAREAVKRLPYLKSLNQLANDQKGSANFGASLAFFGLEDWALELAQQSYNPYWGGSHLFLADRYSGEFNKNSKLFQGFLSDPLAFGASNRFSSLLQRSGHYGMLEFNYDKTAYELSMPSVTLSGLNNDHMPVAYFVQAMEGRATGFPIDVGVSTNLPVFSDASGRADIGATVTTLGLGLQPTDQLGLFAYHNAFQIKLNGHNTVLELEAIRPDQLTGTTFDVDIEQNAVGLSYRWSPTSQTWFKMGNSKSVYEVLSYPTLFATDTVFGILSVNAKPSKQFDDIQLHHTLDMNDATRLSFGLEHVRETQYSEVEGTGPVASYDSSLKDYLIFVGSNDIARRFTSLSLALQHRLSPALKLDASLVTSQVSEQVQGDNALIALARQTIKPTSILTNETRRTMSASLGLVIQPNEQLSIRAAYQDWVRPLSVSTLNSVETAGIAQEDRLMVAGGRMKRGVVQIGLTPDARTFLSAKLDHQDIHNPIAPGVDLRTPSLPFLEALRNAQNVNLSTLDLLEDTPEVQDGSVNALTLGASRLLTANWSGYVKYTLQNTISSFVDSDAPNGRVTGMRIAYFPRNTLAVGSTWASGQRVFLGARAVYRSERFEDMYNLTPWPASWSVDLLATWEAQDKRWSVGIGALNLGGNKSPRQFERYVLDARFRF